ncbi:MAG: hypothetical protein N3G20_08040 [Verrucomicrobiae bacterium]|nr:hypothetical protein [Verrucomicrobiae bacterium]
MPCESGQRDGIYSRRWEMCGCHRNRHQGYPHAAITVIVERTFGYWHGIVDELAAVEIVVFDLNDDVVFQEGIEP